MGKVFIIGQHRTGSTLLKNILDAHPRVEMAFDEMNLFEPCRNNTLDKFLEDSKVSVDDFVGQINQKKIYGTFWKDFEKSGVGLEELKIKLNEATALSSAEILNFILDQLRKKEGAKYSGVKYPVHFRRLDYLIDHWPDAKVIFLTRHPKAIIASKLNDEATVKRKSKSLFHSFLAHYFTILYFAIEYIFSVQTYLNFNNRLKLVTYESLVLNQEEEIKDICQWLDLKFKDSMLEVGGKASSHKHSNTDVKGLHTNSLDKYKTVLNSFDTALISMLTDRYYNKIKNELSINL